MRTSSTRPLMAVVWIVHQPIHRFLTALLTSERDWFSSGFELPRGSRVTNLSPPALFQCGDHESEAVFWGRNLHHWAYGGLIANGVGLSGGARNAPVGYWTQNFRRGDSVAGLLRSFARRADFRRRIKWLQASSLQVRRVWTEKRFLLLLSLVVFLRLGFWLCNVVIQGAEAQLQEVWEEADGLNKNDFDPRTFFYLHGKFQDI